MDCWCKLLQFITLVEYRCTSLLLQTVCITCSAHDWGTIDVNYNSWCVHCRYKLLQFVTFVDCVDKLLHFMNLLDFEVLQFVTGGDLCYASDDEVKLRHMD